MAPVSVSFRCRLQVRIQTRPAGTYSGISNCMTTLVRTEGAASLYRGLMSPVLGYGLIKATAFASYNKAKQITKDYNYKEGQPSRTSSTQRTAPHRTAHTGAC